MHVLLFRRVDGTTIRVFRHPLFHGRNSRIGVAVIGDNNAEQINLTLSDARALVEGVRAELDECYPPRSVMGWLRWQLGLISLDDRRRNWDALRNPAGS
jgi:hypothetical protein